MNIQPIALIVEDNEDQNMVFTMALDQAGYMTESFQNGLNVQKRLAEITPDIVVLDLHIPGVNGKALLSQIRSDRRLSDTRVILATADAGLAIALQPQADLILLKPISFSQLNKLAGRFLHHPRHRDLPAADAAHAAS